jgi:hypothetical protein
MFSENNERQRKKRVTIRAIVFKTILSFIKNRMVKNNLLHRTHTEYQKKPLAEDCFTASSHEFSLRRLKYFDEVNEYSF